MTAISPENLTILRTILNREYVPHLPPLLDLTRPLDEQTAKNVSRALSAFVVSKICRVGSIDASASVVDDFNDRGIDAIYYDFTTRTLYIIQSKLRASEQFGQDEALPFVIGVRKIIAQDFIGFNDNVINRVTDIRGALESCDKIQLVIAYCGVGISQTATQVVNELLQDQTHGEERLCNEVIYFHAETIAQCLEDEHAFSSVDAELIIEKYTRIDTPRLTCFGLINLSRLIEINNEYGEAFFEKNIRTFLGRETGVNTSIQNTLSHNPENFVYLNNGITILCKEITPRNVVDGDGKRLETKGISVINGAQTIASSAKFCADNAGNDISAAKVSVTLILDDAEDATGLAVPFGQQVTRSRNHQNPVYLADFVALDEIQERLRRFIALSQIVYVYKATGADRIMDDDRIYVDEAAQALAVVSNDFRNAVYLKKTPLQFLNRDSDKYQSLFTNQLTSFQVINSVKLNRYIQHWITSQANGCAGIESQIYRNGNFVFAWVMVKRLTKVVNSDKLVDVTKIPEALGQPLDNLRLTLFNQTQNLIGGNSVSAFFQNQGQLKLLIKNMMIEHFGITLCAGLAAFEAANPDGFFEHLIRQAPQIENLV
jgi:AIPR protein